MPSRWVIRLDGLIMIAAQASEDQYKKILSYFDVGKQELRLYCAAVKLFIKAGGWSGTIWWLQKIRFWKRNA